MKNLLKNLKTLAVAGMTMDLALGERAVTFDANQFPALKDRALKDVKIAAKVE